jgi:chromosome segregation ATPase
MSNLDQELEAVTQRRKKVVAELERLRGRKEQAETNLRAVEEEIRSKGIDPADIEDKLQQLETKYRSLVEELKKDVEEAERALAPFVSRAM